MKTQVRSQESHSQGGLHYWHSFVKCSGIIDNSFHVLGDWILVTLLAYVYVDGIYDWYKRCTLSDGKLNDVDGIYLVQMGL